MKIIDYFGEKVKVSDWAKFITTNENGETWQHKERPYMGTYKFVPQGKCSRVEIKNMDSEWAFYYWYKSLKEIV